MVVLIYVLCVYCNGHKSKIQYVKNLCCVDNISVWKDCDLCIAVFVSYVTVFSWSSDGEVMLSFRGRVKDLLIGFSQRLQLAYESKL